MFTTKPGKQAAKKLQLNLTVANFEKNILESGACWTSSTIPSMELFDKLVKEVLDRREEEEKLVEDQGKKKAPDSRATC